MREADARAVDREILRLAVPALGALAAEPLYVLVDTAVVGHLGTDQLAALAISATLLTGSYTIFNFLTYATTAQVARLHGAGQDVIAGRIAAQALWLSLAIGAVLAAFWVGLARPVVELMGADGRVSDLAVLYLRISAIGLPCAMVALAGQGYLRGISDFRRPLVIVIAANAVNVVLELVFVYGFGWGIAGSAWGTVIAQLGMAAAFAAELLRAPADSRRPRREYLRPLTRVGGDIAVRTAALYASFLLGSAIAAHIGAASLGAHQIGFQLFTFLALVLDAIAIAGQVIVGRSLGAGYGERAYASARRMIGWSVVVGAGFAVVLAALAPLLPHAFTDDPRVIHHAHSLWPFLAAMQPAAGAVFALDGILIGAGDTRYLKWAMVFAFACFAVAAVSAYEAGLGVAGLWGALLLLILVRLATLAVRFERRRWIVTGAPAAG